MRISQHEHAPKLERVPIIVPGVPHQVVMFLVVDATVIHSADIIMTVAVMLRV
jgi:hypothetical protein